MKKLSLVLYIMSVGWLGCLMAGPQVVEAALQPRIEVPEDEPGEVDISDEEEVIAPEEDESAGDGEADSRCAVRDPVLLVHGLNSSPAMWNEEGNDYLRRLVGLGYPEGFVAGYYYSDGAQSDGKYNNQGAVAEVVGGMREAVLELSEISVSCGNSGRVAIVAHSMGGLVAREYVSRYPDNHKVSRLISVGTPFQGSWVLDKEGDRQVFSDILLQAAGQWLDLDMASGAIADLRPESELINRLNLVESLGVDYVTLWGEVAAQYDISLLNIVIRSERVSIGDGVVSAWSGSTVSPFVASTEDFGLRCWEDYEVELVPIWSLGGVVGYRYRIPGLTEAALNWQECLHTNLLSSSVVQSRVWKYLPEGKVEGVS